MGAWMPEECVPSTVRSSTFNGSAKPLTFPLTHSHLHSKVRASAQEPLHTNDTNGISAFPSLAGLDIDIDMSSDGLAFTFTNGIRVGVCVSSLLLPDNEREE